LGGNLGTGSPIGDSPPVLLALDARLVLTSVRGEREVPLAEYFTGYRTSVRTDDELIRAVRVPLPLLPRTSFLKVAKRRFDDISSVAVAIAADLDGGVVRQVRIGLGGVAATPVRAQAAAAALEGRAWDLRAHAVASAAALAGGVVRQVRIGLGGVAATPVRAQATEAALEGRPWDLETVTAAAAVLAGEGTPIDDHRASARYRAAMLEQSLLRFYD